MFVFLGAVTGPFIINAPGIIGVDVATNETNAKNRRKNFKWAGKKRLAPSGDGLQLMISAKPGLFNAYRMWVLGVQKLCPAPNRWLTCASVRSEDATVPPNTPRRKKSSTLRFSPLKPKKWKCVKFGGVFVFLRHVGQVKTERDAGICQPLSARE
jgi:hypothetical protein